MNWEPQDERSIRSYLLKTASSEEEQTIEERMLRDYDYASLVEMIEDEIIDDYARGAMSKEERSQFEKSFAMTPSRRQKVMISEAAANHAVKQTRGRANSERELGSWWQRFLVPSWKPVMIAAMLLLGTFAVWNFRTRDTLVDRGMAALNERYKRERPLNARISGLDYAPFTVRLGQNDPTSAELTARDRAERLLLDAVAESPGPASHHALGRFYLAEKKIEQAISEFDLALSEEPSDASLHSDLGAALLEKSNLEASTPVGRDPKTFNNALKHLNRALELKESHLEALFNRALLKRAGGLTDSAKEDWKLYLQKDPSSSWAAEARNHLEEIERSEKRAATRKEDLFSAFLNAVQAGNDQDAWNAFSESSFRTGNYIFDRLVDEVIDSRQSLQSEMSERQLLLLTHAGLLAEKNSGDRYFLALANYYKKVPVETLVSLRHARRLGKQAFDDLFRSSRVKEAFRGFVDSKRIHERVGNPGEALLVDLGLAYCYLFNASVVPGLNTLIRLESTSKARRYRWLQSLALIGLANVDSRTKDFSGMLANGDLANRLSTEIGDPNGRLRYLLVRAGAYVDLGRVGESWQSAIRGLELGDRVGADASQTIGYYSVCARNFENLGYFATATEYALETARLAKSEHQTPLVISRYLAHLGSLYARQNSFDSALYAFNEALSAAESRKGEDVGREMVSFVRLSVARLYRRSGAHSDSLRTIDNVLSFALPQQDPWLIHAARKERALTLAAQGSTAMAYEALNAAFEENERLRARILEESSRVSYFHKEQDIYDVAIDVGISHPGESHRAFMYSEMSRARSLLDLVTTPAGKRGNRGSNDISKVALRQPMQLDEIRARMPAHWQLLQYAVLEDKLVIWLLSRTSFEARTVEISEEKLSDLIMRCLDEFSSPPVSPSANAFFGAQQLYELLVEPVSSLLEPNSSLCIVPDKALTLVPFAALHAANSGHYLIEDHVISYSPSATLFILLTEVAGRKSSHVPEQVLSIGNPRFDRRRWKDLPDIPEAAREAKEIAHLYDEPRLLLTEDAATKSAFLKGLSSANVIHLATHGVSDRNSLEFSGVLLAQTKNEEGILTVSEIRGLDLSNTRLVILSACRTQVEGFRKGEGALGISRSFHAAGVPIVIASVWDVDSASTSRLMIDIHQRRKRASTAEALRDAQIGMIRGTSTHKHPFFWAGFVNSGGMSTY